jgi:hypothetical protein
MRYGLVTRLGCAILAWIWTSWPALPPRTQCARILDAVLGDAGHPDDYALRRATAEHLKNILLSATAPSPEGTIRGFLAEWIFQLGLVELGAQVAGGQLVPQQTARRSGG